MSAMTTASKTTTKIVGGSRLTHSHLLSDDRDCEIGRPMRNPAKGGEPEEEHNDLRAVRSSPTAAADAAAAAVDGGVLKCKIQKERIGRRGRRFRLLIMKKE